MRRRLLALLVATTSLLGVALIAPAPASAACGGWAPGGGILTARKEGGDFIVRTVFRFSTAEIAALRCTGSRSLEVDVLTYGGVKRGARVWSSNLPGRYLDTEALDGYPRVLTVGSDNIGALQPDVEYFTDIRVYNYTLAVDKPYAELYLNFQRGYRFPGCIGSPATCNFSNGDTLMQGYLTVNPRISVVNGDAADSVAWGRYRKTTLFPNERLNVGDRIISPNNLNYLVMQADGNLVEYIPGGRAVWASGTRDRGSIFIMQGDGNGVIVAPGNRPVWSTRTGARNSVLEIQDDRNVVVYAPGHIAVWANGTAGKP